MAEGKGHLKVAETKKRGAQKHSLATIAYEEIKRRIVTGVISPGYPILESNLAAELGISRTPLREALARLRQEELLVSIRRKGIFASTLSADDMQEISEMLAALEGMAVRLAAERATSEEMRLLEEAVRAQERALDEDDIEAWSAADEAFHATVLAAAHNRRIQEAVARVHPQWRQLQHLTIRLRPKPTKSTDRHRATMEAIKARQGERAREIDQRDRGETYTTLIDILRAIGSRPMGL